MAKFKDLTGKTFNRLTVLERGKDRFSSGGYRKTIWKCKCECGNITYVSTGNILNSNTKSCGCLLREYENGCKVKTRKGTKDIPGVYWDNLKRGAKERNLEVNITIDYIQDLLEKQNFKCALSGVKLECGYKKKGDFSNTLSLDRIDSTKGYVPENVQWVHKDINKLKMGMPNSVFINHCVNIANYKQDNFKLTEKQIKEFYDIHI